MSVCSSVRLSARHSIWDCVKRENHTVKLSSSHSSLMLLVSGGIPKLSQNPVGVK